VAPAVSQRDLVGADDRLVVAPGVVVGAAAGVRELPVELDPHPVPLAPAVHSDPPPADLAPGLQRRPREAVGALDVAVVVPLQRRLHALLGLAQDVAEEPAPPLRGTGVEDLEHHLRRRARAHRTRHDADDGVGVCAPGHQVEDGDLAPCGRRVGADAVLG